MATRPSRAAAPLEAYVLHRYDWSESSLVLDLFTREHGRLAVAAKGAKRPTSQLRSVLLPFQRILVTLTRPQAQDGEAPEVQTLRSAEWAGGVPTVGGAALFAGFYLNELLMKLLARQDPHERLFDAYGATLAGLGADETATQTALRAFELMLLRETGVLPELTVETLTQQPLQAEHAYTLSPEAGVVPARSGQPGLSGASLRLLQQALDAGGTPALQDACRPALPALRVLLRTMLHYHLGTGTLRTREVMQGVQRLHDTPLAP